MKFPLLQSRNLGYSTEIRGFPDGVVGGWGKILHVSTLTNIFANFHDATLRIFGVPLLYIWVWNYLV